MKRILILIITLLVATPLALGIMAGLSYYTTRADHIPQPTITLLDQEIKPSGYQWRSPVFGGLIHRDFVQKSPARIEDIGEVNTSRFEFAMPSGYDANVVLTKMGETVWSGRATDFAGYEFLDNGRYRIFVESIRPMETERGYGSIFYQGAFTVTVDPRYKASEDWVAQGDVMAIRLYNLGSTLQPRSEGDLGEIPFVPGQMGEMTAYVPVGHEREPGSYVIYAGAGRSNWEIPLRVTGGDFPSRQVELEAGQSWPLNASDAPAGYPDYQQQIQPFFSQRDNAQYWSGVFISPLMGEIATEYGLSFFVGEAKQGVQHAGIDIPADKGTDVVATNHGRVVFAGMLESTGNTLVIEHGGGLKSYYFHLDTLTTQTDAWVQQGDVVGTVGDTGICQEPHLHYEVRIGQETLNPTLLFNKTGRLYWFE